MRMMGFAEMGSPEPFEVYAIRYATDPNWPRWKSYVHDEAPEERVRMDFFSWLAAGRSGTFIIDTGCAEDRLRGMKIEPLRGPLATLDALGVRAERVENVILSHLHFDHTGNTDKFPSATIHVQEKELSFATGPYMRFEYFSRAYFPEDIAYVLRQEKKGKVRRHNGRSELAPGISLHLVGGHTMGMQVIRIFTRRGWITLASDALHYYREIELGRPWSSNAFSVADMLDAHDTIQSLSDSADHIIPAHDPLVLKRYPAVSAALRRLAVRLHEPPMPATDA